MDLGVNLFGVLSQSTLPEAETLQRLRDIGYTHIEPCLALDPIPGMERVFWSVSHFSVLLPVIRQISLQVPSAHLLGRNLNARSEALCRLAREAGIRAYVVKAPQEADESALQQAAMTYLTLADTLAEAGVKLLLHNEAADIRARSHGKTVCERLADLCQGRVGLQADVGWAMAGGEDPVSFLYRNRNAVFSLHYKDFDAAGNPFVLRDNADEIHWTWDGGNKTSESYWAGGEPAVTTKGYHAIRYEYTGEGKVSAQIYLDEDGKNVIVP